MALRFKMGLLAAAMTYTAAAFPQTVADPAYANMQRAMGGIIQSATASRGYDAADPRTYATLRSVGTATAAAAATAGAGLLIGGTAPAWGSVLAMAALGGAVSYGVSVGIDSAVKWAFGTNATTPVTVTSTPTAFGSTGVILGQPCYSVDLGNLCGSSPQEVLTNHVLTTTVFVDLTTINLTPETVGSAGYVNGRRYFATISGHRSDLPGPIYNNMNGWYIWLMNAKVTCPAGFIQNGTQCVSSMIGQYIPTPVGATQVSLTNAIAQLTDAQKQTAVSYEAMALMINQMWQKAAAQPGYAGVPYAVTNPVTAAQVQAWAQANPSAYPNVGQLTAPVTSTPTGFQPSTTTVAGTPLAPASSPTSPTATNASTTPEINLGPDPNVTFQPPDTPTADSIFKPFTDIAAPFVNFQFNAPAGACPKPTFQVFGASLAMTQHCDIFEQLRGTIQTVMSAVFLIAAFVIVFTA